MIDPVLLPIVPPMDLNRTMPGIDRISPFPLELRSRASVGLFGTRRSADQRRIRRLPMWFEWTKVSIYSLLSARLWLWPHQGRSLVAAQLRCFSFTITALGTSRSTSTSATSVLWRTVTWSLQDSTLPRSGTSATKITCISRFGTRSTLDPTRANSLPVDPTMVLYSWEERRAFRTIRRRATSRSRRSEVLSTWSATGC